MMTLVLSPFCLNASYEVVEGRPYTKYTVTKFELALIIGDFVIGCLLLLAGFGSQASLATTGLLCFFAGACILPLIPIMILTIIHMRNAKPVMLRMPPPDNPVQVQNANPPVLNEVG